jgi:hypothetical protein
MSGDGPVFDVIRIHIASDDSEDCDDELAKLYLRQLNDAFTKIEFTYIFTGAQNLTAEQSRDHWLKTFEPYVSELPGSVSTHEVKFYTLDEYTLLPHVECDYFLQIAPVRSYDGANLTVTEKYVLAGDRIAPEGQVASFNMKDSDVITKKFFDEGKLIDIPSLHMATMRMDSSLLECINQPKNPFIKYILFIAFKFAFCRMPPTCPVAEKFSIGLVTPGQGRAANYHSVMALAKALQIDKKMEFVTDEDGVWGPVVHMVDARGDPLRPDAPFCAAQKYFTDIFADKLNSGLGIPKPYYRLAQINTVLAAVDRLSPLEHPILGPYHPPNLFCRKSKCNPEVFYSDFGPDNIPVELEPAWKIFMENSQNLTDSFNPVYDLFAAYVLVGLINGEDRRTHTREEFLKNIVQEF